MRSSSLVALFRFSSAGESSPSSHLQRAKGDRAFIVIRRIRIDPNMSMGFVQKSAYLPEPIDLAWGLPEGVPGNGTCKPSESSERRDRTHLLRRVNPQIGYQVFEKISWEKRSES